MSDLTAALHDARIASALMPHSKGKQRHYYRRLLRRSLRRIEELQPGFPVKLAP